MCTIDALEASAFLNDSEATPPPIAASRAREEQAAFEVIEKRGKGGHWLVRWNGRVTTIPQSKGGDLKPGTLTSILEKLGIDARDL